MASFSQSIYNKSPIFLQNLFVSTEGYRLKRQRFGLAFFQRLDHLENSVNQTENWHNERNVEDLRSLAALARTNVPYYAETFGAAKLDERDIKSLDDLAKFPVLLSDTARQRSDDLVNRMKPRRHLVPGRTSGSTGSERRLLNSLEALVEEFATVWRLRRSMGVQLGDRNATFNGRPVVPLRQKQGPYWRSNRAFNQLLFSQWHFSPQTAEDYIRRLTAEPFAFWWGYPSFMSMVCEALTAHCGHVAHPPQAVFPSSENLLPWQRRALEEATGAPVRNRYGTNELAVSMSECEAGRLHVDREMGIVEVDVRSSDSETETGPLLVTGLRNFGNVLIRYEVGDVGTRCKHPCSCGRAGPTFLCIDGRLHDFVVTPDGRRIGLMGSAFKGSVKVKEAQICQDARDRIVLRVVRRPDFEREDEMHLLKTFHERLGNDMTVDLEYVDQIPRLPNGKFRAVVSSLPEAAMGVRDT